MSTSKQSNQNDDSPLGKVFSVLGIFAALAVGGSNDMEAGPIFFLVLIFAGIGYYIGQFVEEVIARVIFVISSIVLILFNAAVRRILWEIFSAIFGN